MCIGTKIFVLVLRCSCFHVHRDEDLCSCRDVLVFHVHRDEEFSAAAVSPSDVIHANKKDIPCIFRVSGLIMIKVIIIIIMIALKGEITRLLQSAHCTANCLQHVCLSGQCAIVWKSRATYCAHHVQYVLNTNVWTPAVLGVLNAYVFLFLYLHLFRVIMFHMERRSRNIVIIYNIHTYIHIYINYTEVSLLLLREYDVWSAKASGVLQVTSSELNPPGTKNVILLLAENEKEKDKWLRLLNEIHKLLLSKNLPSNAVSCVAVSLTANMCCLEIEGSGPDWFISSIIYSRVCECGKSC